MDQTFQQLVAAIEVEVADARKMANRCNVLGTLAAGVGFVGSAAATILAAAKIVDGPALAAVAAVPGLAAAANQTFKLSARVAWHTRKMLSMMELRDQLELGLTTPAEGAQRKAEILSDLEDRWNNNDQSPGMSVTRQSQAKGAK